MTGIVSATRCLYNVVMARKTRDENMVIRVSADERERWRRQAERADLSLSDWVRHTLNAALRGDK